MKKKIVCIILACCMTFGESISVMVTENTLNVNEVQTTQASEENPKDVCSQEDNMTGIEKSEINLEDENTEQSGANTEEMTEEPPEQGKVESKTEVQLNPGWNKIEGKWYYGDENGNAKTGWIKVGSVCYYLMNAEESLENPGKMIESQEYIINGSTYLFDSNGAMKTGWIFNDGWYYYNKSGAKASG